MANFYQSIVWKFLQNTYARSLARKFQVEVQQDAEEPKPPFIFLGNHAYRGDPFILGHFTKYPLNYMANVEAGTLLQRIGSNLVGVFAKKKGMPDLYAVRTMFELIKRGYAVGIFAEGDRCWDGETAEIIKNIPGLVKMAKVPIRLARLRGNYLCMPRWAEVERQGKILVDFTTIGKEELESLSKTELFQKISNFLYRNDVKDPELRSYTFGGQDLALGIQYLIWLCPACRSHDTIKGEGNTIICTHCQGRWQLDGYGSINPANEAGVDIKDWSDWQKREIEKNVDLENHQKPITISKDVELQLVEGKKELTCGAGDLILFKDKTCFLPNIPQVHHGPLERYDYKEQLVFENKKIQYYIDNFNRNFMFSHGENRYKVFFKGKNACKWIFFFNALQKK
jgi:1-acyl-sn-glycerol-3-phosphate acyltransferase